MHRSITSSSMEPGPDEPPSKHPRHGLDECDVVPDDSQLGLLHSSANAPSGSGRFEREFEESRGFQSPGALTKGPHTLDLSAVSADVGQGRVRTKKRPIQYAINGMDPARIRRCLLGNIVVRGVPGNAQLSSRSLKFRMSAIRTLHRSSVYVLACLLGLFAWCGHVEANKHVPP